MTLSPEEVTRKKQWRTRLLAERTEKTEGTRSAEAAALRTSILEHIGGSSPSGSSPAGRAPGDSAPGNSAPVTVCAYVPIGSEPGSPDLLDGLREYGCRVLLPIVVGAEPLEWAEYTGPESLRSARYGLLEPAGTHLGQTALGDADVVLVPALAVDRNGTRLGRGGGHYDRSLPLADSRAQLIAVVSDHEFVDHLPGEAHDVRMSAVLTPERGVVPLPL
ncbi:5-formyltetrahydrofolate cyclo-ligase [Haloactinomyces albus]|uniref:5-formyltetrahydrofolate cyclo-ligase n=1 Tax=Haloactinomyces albus TaxID=1352928 RepID=A0AAE3ZAM0_9ACTN|nr:5-formyltetrahydrofolate cyclo-ligase [Haloactinomyces albus]MDR7301383.1 5-formyltetrahydrofolate cyclo-ligase [Haloactinomyces albus]